ncbi:D-aminoacyl-tRNA deacylase [Hetaerina americana]|uniref:D-aminoacyl-tRNA deacylase n=1 Tax=Hetaerina americana TaxID=62018 RepID=UPI003A7F17D0
MKVVVQRVTSAKVTVGESLISSIGRGLCVLVGISRDDTPKDIEYIVRKILNVRFFEGENKKRWSHSVKDKQFEILCVSQFTLCHMLKGNKLDFHHAMGPKDSEAFYNEFLNALQKSYEPHLIKDGKFGEYMQVSIVNDGPVTLHLESPSTSKDKDSSQNLDDGEQVAGKIE